MYHVYTNTYTYTFILYFTDERETITGVVRSLGSLSFSGNNDEIRCCELVRSEAEFIGICPGYSVHI